MIRRPPESTLFPNPTLFRSLVTVIGMVVTVRAWRAGEIAPPWRAHAGALVAGWGIFNLVDSANHFVLGLHPIRDRKSTRLNSSHANISDAVFCLKKKNNTVR